MSEIDAFDLDDEESELFDDAAETLEDAGYDVVMNIDLGSIRAERPDDHIAVNVSRDGSSSISHTDATEAGGGPDASLRRVGGLIEYRFSE